LKTSKCVLLWRSLLWIRVALTRSWMGNFASRRRSNTILLTNRGVTLICEQNGHMVIRHTDSLMGRRNPKTYFRKIPPSMVGWFCSFRSYNIASRNRFSCSVILWFYVTNQFFKMAIKSLRRKNTHFTKWSDFDQFIQLYHPKTAY
jgi:hypothetical protein